MAQLKWSEGSMPRASNVVRGSRGWRNVDPKPKVGEGPVDGRKKKKTSLISMTKARGSGR